MTYAGSANGVQAYQLCFPLCLALGALVAVLCIRSSTASTSGCNEQHGTGSRAQRMQEVMFNVPGDTEQFIEMCGRDWSKLFVSWERVQRMALNGDRSVKAVVWKCRGSCGGLGDRQRGILTSFVLALVLERAFLIDSEEPVPLRHYFHLADPTLHWVFDESLLTGRSSVTEEFMNSDPPQGHYSTANLSYYDNYDYIIQSNNFWQPFHVLHNPAVSNSVELFRQYDEHVLAGCVLNYLLVPARDIQDQLRRVRSSVSASQGRLLAVQLRTGDSISKNGTVLREYIAMFCDCVRKIQMSRVTRMSVFLTTDSSEAAAMFQAEFPDAIVFAGEIFHVDIGKPQSPDAAFRKLVLDHMMISHADHLLISRSGFAEYAALRGFKSYYTPMRCDVSSPISHYSLPTRMPPGPPGGDVHSMDSMLSALAASET